MDNTFKDFLGQEIAVGDIIVYPTRQGSNLDMNYALVLSRQIVKEKYRDEPYKRLKILKRHTDFWRREVTGEKVTYTEILDRVVVVKRYYGANISEDTRFQKEAQLELLWDSKAFQSCRGLDSLYIEDVNK